MKILIGSLIIVSSIMGNVCAMNNNSDIPLPPENCPVNELKIESTVLLQQIYGAVAVGRNGKTKRYVLNVRKRKPHGSVESYDAWLTDKISGQKKDLDNAHAHWTALKNQHQQQQNNRDL